MRREALARLEAKLVENSRSNAQLVFTKQLTDPPDIIFIIIVSNGI